MTGLINLLPIQGLGEKGDAGTRFSAEGADFLALLLQLLFPSGMQTPEEALSPEAEKTEKKAPASTPLIPLSFSETNAPISGAGEGSDSPKPVWLPSGTNPLQGSEEIPDLRGGDSDKPGPKALIPKDSISKDPSPEGPSVKKIESISPERAEAGFKVEFPLPEKIAAKGEKFFPPSGGPGRNREEGPIFPKPNIKVSLAQPDSQKVKGSPGPEQIPPDPPLRSGAPGKVPYPSGHPLSSISKTPGTSAKTSPESDPASRSGERILSGTSMRKRPEFVEAYRSGPISSRTVSSSGSSLHGPSGEESSHIRPEGPFLSSRPDLSPPGPGHGLHPEALEVPRLPSYTPGQLSEMIRDLLLEVHPSGEKKARVKLEPPDLGEMEIDLRLHRQEVHLFLRVEKPEAAQELQAHLHHLRQNLEELGFTLTDFRVDLAGGGSGWRYSEERSFHEHRKESPGRTSGVEKIKETAPKEGPLRPWHNGALNLVV
ncbi:MAG TPA: hypothetical protein ENJ40_01260 [Thermosulfurimonas dismutans]|uniref:Flagellar hook-length control protein-like C-terminal domain-containing protein n=1 Tax=Thermosulfurimonas dismutans TaxID=999894 RepID=A0A7C3CQY6_9BACT|nr:hypothetical protein [Thermosulfurimonas dismutans]